MSPFRAVSGWNRSDAILIIEGNSAGNQSQPQPNEVQRGFKTRHGRQLLASGYPMDIFQTKLNKQTFVLTGELIKLMWISLETLNQRLYILVYEQPMVIRKLKVLICWVIIVNQDKPSCLHKFTISQFVLVGPQNLMWTFLRNME